MAKQVINIGTTANDGTGDALRSAFDKVNDNFTELYDDDAGDVGSIIAGTGISVDQATGNVTVTNSAPDQTVTLAEGANVTITGTYPNFTIASDDVVGAVNSVNGQAGVVVLDSADISEDTNLYYTEARVSANTNVAANTAKTGITTQQASDITANNAKVSDQTVTLTEGTNVTITGTYPNFTIASDDVVGAVNSVNGQTGVVTLDSADISEDTNLYYTEARVSANSAVTLNTAKTGITSGQASAITANTAKTGITSSQASAITANTAKISYNSGASAKLASIETNADVTDSANVTLAGALMDSEVTNLADVKSFDPTDYLASSVTTITTQQASDITTNNAKTGITSGQASAITANTAKTGITSGQASAIVTNTNKTSFPGFGTTSGTSLEGNTSLLALGTSSSTALAGNTTTISGAQASAISANTAKTGITSGQASAISANTAKTGITSSQASAITANTAKVGITSSQASAITANTAKTGITSSQASAITANSSKTGITSSQASAITANTSKVSNATHTGEVTGDVALTITNDAVTFDKLGVEYTTSTALTSASAITVNTALSDVFTFTAGHSATLNFTNVGIGDLKSFVITGGGGSYTLAFGTSNAASATYNKISGDFSDTSSAKNLIQIKFVAVNEAWYSISQIAS